MKISEQCCTLEQARKLSKLGIESESMFSWVEFDGHFALCRLASNYEVTYDNLSWIIVGEVPAPLQEYLDEYGDDATASGSIYNAYNVAELGVMIGLNNLPYFDGRDDCWKITTGTLEGYGTMNEAKVRALLLIKLIEIKAISVKQVNQRL